MSTLTKEQLRAAAEARVRNALAHIQEAQNHLGAAREQLSALCGGIPVWKSAGKLYDRVHTFWYRVERFRQRGRFKLDDSNIKALERQAQERHS